MLIPEHWKNAVDKPNQFEKFFFEHSSLVHSDGDVFQWYYGDNEVVLQSRAADKQWHESTIVAHPVNPVDVSTQETNVMKKVFKAGLAAFVRWNGNAATPWF